MCHFSSTPSFLPDLLVRLQDGLYENDIAESIVGAILHLLTLRANLLAERWVCNSVFSFWVC